MDEPLDRITETDIVEKTDRAHEVFLKKLRQRDESDRRQRDKSDRSFAYWLSSAALNLCSIVNHVDLNGKLKHADELAQAVKDGFEQVKDLLDDLSAEDKDDINFSQALFTQAFERKQSTPSEVTGATESEKEVVPEAMTSQEPFAMQFETEETKCAICRGPFKTKILPCSHIFCLGCLEMAGSRTEKKPGDMMSCEICGQEFNIPKEGFDCLENFSAVEKMIDPAQVLDPSSKVNICETCADNRDLNFAQKIPPAVTYCVDCDQNLCAECRRNHEQFKLLKMHKLHDFDDPQNVTALFTQLRITSETDDFSDKYKSDPGLIATIRTKAAKEMQKPIVGLTILDNELFVVSDECSEVEVYDSTNFSFSRCWNLKELINPMDIGSCNKKKCLYIFDYKGNDQSKEILTVDQNGKLIFKWSTGTDWGYGLSVTDESNVILAVSKQNKLCEYLPDGQLISKINLLSYAHMHNPFHAIKLTSGNYVVCNGIGKSNQHRVRELFADGKVEKSFGGKAGSTIGQMNSPTYLCVVGNGYVMVADRENSRVLLLDSKLKFKREILSREKLGLFRPKRILLDESSNRLFVVDVRILIFQFGQTR